jgi:general secretion pathway protein A
VLEEIRMLSNLETESEKLLQILLIGQTEFKEKLLQKELSQLRQRITVTVHLDPLTKEEMEGYIRFRISKVSNNGSGDLFSKDAIEKIYEHSNGIPRLVNSICDGSLLVGYANGAKAITGNMVSEAVEDFLSFACLTNK